MKPAVSIAVLGLIAFLAGCGSSSLRVLSNGGVTAQVSIMTSTSNATVPMGASQAFTATVTGASNTGVTWSIQEGSAGGTIDATGKYTAPKTAGTYHIIVTSMADPSKSVVITVTVTSVTTGNPVSISVSPSVAGVKELAPFKFVASFAGTTNTSANWSVVEGAAGGTIDSNGNYTAPNTTGTFHVMATTAADPTKSATAAVVVTGPGVVVTLGCPSCVQGQSGTTLNFEVTPGTKLQFTATVTGTSSTAVSWSAGGLSASGTIDQNGLFTAGSTLGQTGVTATSVATPSAQAFAIITITDSPHPPSLALSPPAANMLGAGMWPFASSVDLGTDYPYAPVRGNVTKIWSVQEGPAGGTVDANGVYTAPQATGTYHVVVTAPSLNLTSTSTITVLAPSIGIFTAQQPPPAFTLEGPSTGGALAQLSDSSVLAAGGIETALPSGTGPAFLALAGVFSVDAQGNLVSTRVGDMQVAHSGAAATRLQDGRVLVVGGQSGAGLSCIADAEIYDPATKTFSATAPLSVARCTPTAITLPDGRVLVLGPEGTSSNSTTYSAEIYDPKTGTFGSKIANLPPLAASALLPDGRVLLAGGVLSGSTGTTSAVLLDPTTQTLTPTGSMGSPRIKATALTLRDGTVLVAGGFNDSSRVTSAEIYDPKSGMFSAAGNMLEPQGSLGAIQLPSGKVLLVGGSTKLAELYDPAARSFSFAAETMVQHSGLHMFLMPDGTVMVTDGPTDTFEFYHP